ncbi:phenylalanine--tRNA ligase subunit beta [Gurleya vavrai]
MPTVSINKNILHKKLELDLSTNPSDILFDFGLEIDDEIIEDNETIYKIEVGANRYDLLCLEGIVNALRVYLGKETYKNIQEVNIKDNVQEVNIKDNVKEVSIENNKNYQKNEKNIKDNLYEKNILYKNTEKKPLKESDYILNDRDKTFSENFAVIHQNHDERPFIASAIIHNLDLTPEVYASFIDYQDKLHSSLGRDRNLIAIGTHDLSKIKFPVFYKKIKREDLSFAPLNQKIMSCDELIKFYSMDNKMKNYCRMLNDEVPVFIDSNGNVLSLPPLINSDYTKLNLGKKSIFVEVTGTDFYKVNIALKMILFNFRGDGYSKIKIKKDFFYKTEKKESENEIDFYKKINKKYNNMVENQKICQKDDLIIYSPFLFNQIYYFTIDEINKELGISLTKDEIKNLLTRMMYDVKINKIIEVYVSDARSDVLNKVDIFEDLAIAYGFNNFKRSNPPVLTIGRENDIEKFSNKTREEMAQCGYNEVLTLTLLSKKDSFGECVSLKNPKSLECEVVRNSLLPGILKSICSNQHTGVPMKIFEVSDVVLKKESIENKKNLCACLVGKVDGLENLIGVCSLIFMKIGLKCEFKEEDNEIYFSGRSVGIYVKNDKVGTLGVLHPKVCNNFRIPFAISSFEINLDKIYEIKNNQ